VTVAIRPAGRDEAEALRALAVASKRHWGYPEDWMARWATKLTLTTDYLRANEVFVAEEAGQLVGFGAMVAEADGATFELDHLWVTPGRIGTGLGRRLFEHARDRAIARGGTVLRWEAEPSAVPFYERMGGRQIGTVVTSMEREVPVMALELR
jgi:GNAT superfamily N-acetyltransferase